MHIDIVGPFPPDRGCRYPLTMIDRTTQWPEAVPIADTTMDTVVPTFIETWVSRFGVPFTVTTDRGVQFTSEAWKANLSLLGINVGTTSSYHPKANGMVERFHRTLKNAMRCAARTNLSWMRSLPWITLGLCNAPRLDTATLTAQVVFGGPQRIPGMCFQAEQSRPISAKEQLAMARSNADSYTPRALDLTKFKMSPFIAKFLHTAEFLFVRDDRLGKPSLAPRYMGPYRVVRRDWDSNTFVIDLGKKEDSVSLSRLKAASVPPEDT